MQKEPSPTNQPRGFSLIELILSSALVLLLATLFTNAVLSGIEGSVTSGSYARANLLAEEGLEATRNIRDDGYSNLSDGTYGIGLSGGAWAFLGTSDTQDGFSRSVQVQTLDATTKQVTSTVTWQLSPTRTGTVTESTYLTNLDTLPTATQADGLLVDVSGAVIGGSTSRELQKIVLQNTGSVPATITKMKISWSPSTSKLTQIFMNGVMVWSTSGPATVLRRYHHHPEHYH